MTHPIRTLITAASTVAVLALFASGPAAAGSNNSWGQPKQVEWFQYVVKFTCGVNTERPLQVVPGVFATEVSVYNYNAGDVTLRKSLALSYPPREQVSGEVSDQIEDVVSPGTALMVDCEEFRDEFVFQNPPPVTDLLVGFLVIESNNPLHIEAVYTAAGEAGDVSIDVERIAERKAFPRPFTRPTKVVICHYPPGNPDKRHTITVDASSVPAHQAHGDTIGPCRNN